MSVNINQIDILMSTYNGDEFLEEQIESLINQTYKNWRLIIRDDGSSDSTLDLINNFRLSMGKQLILIPSKNIGVINSFAKLLENSTAPYVMFCDQDDIWLPNKLQIMLSRMLSVENISTQGTPILIFSDLIPVSSKKIQISDSFWKLHSIRPSDSSLEKLLIQNIVTGCASMANRSLVKSCLPIPTGAIMHDWWFALNASLLGELIHINQPTVLYRQHENNQVGANDVKIKRMIKLTKTPKATKQKISSILMRTSKQASCLLKLKSEKITDRQIMLLRSYSNLKSMSAIKKRYYLFKNNIKFSNLFRNIALFIFA